jgi:hypothetical protein
LAAPPDCSILSADEVRSYPAVEMFEERAAFALGGYQISNTDAPCVAKICPRLDGSPWQSSWPPGNCRGSACKGSPTHLTIVSQSSRMGDAQLFRATKRYGPPSTGATGFCHLKPGGAELLVGF